ncbi:mutanase [Coccidioides immitis H538.4]|uniref:Uncharacterized protein n=3 Tax=Coccidioides immitis TaxID=5501 RepID=A0A0J8QU15_COCIT|nr:hypothetical protein CIRG_03460 [Coccidioides immitis RMSCC 2394]KMU74743.1 hypothetical protein CISG_00673 [Coccidioides immitis RMSCC 3703]KMU83272.1 mutanase [Coccidioides immitis H538.4]
MKLSVAWRHWLQLAALFGYYMERLLRIVNLIILNGVPKGAEWHVRSHQHQSTPRVAGFYLMIPIDTNQENQPQIPPIVKTSSFAGNSPAIGQPVLEPGLVSQVNVFVSVLALEPRDGSIQIGKPTPTKLKANVAGVNHFNVNFDGKLGHVNIVVSTAGREVSRANGVEISTERFEGKVD